MPSEALQIPLVTAIGCIHRFLPTTSSSYTTDHDTIADAIRTHPSWATSNMPRRFKRLKQNTDHNVQKAFVSLNLLHVMSCPHWDKEQSTDYQFHSGFRFLALMHRSRHIDYDYNVKNANKIIYCFRNNIYNNNYLSDVILLISHSLSLSLTPIAHGKCPVSTCFSRFPLGTDMIYTNYAKLLRLVTLRALHPSFSGGLFRERAPGQKHRPVLDLIYVTT